MCPCLCAALPALPPSLGPPHAPQQPVRHREPAAPHAREEGLAEDVILAVAHDCLRDKGSSALRAHGREGHVLFDLKSVFSTEESELRL